MKKQMLLYIIFKTLKGKKSPGLQTIEMFLQQDENLISAWNLEIDVH